MLLFAHRGCHAHAPENSLEAFEAAIAQGVDGIETDVRLSADGLPVIIHDRVTPRGREVALLTRRQIEDDVGHGVPLLAEILEAFPDVLWNIEIKNPEAWQAASRVLAQYQSRRRLLVSSFRHDVIERCAQELAIECALLLAHRPLDVNLIMSGFGSYPRVCGMVWDCNVIDDAVLSSVTGYGWRNYVYGTVTAAEHQRCAALGLSGLITDYPLLIRPQT
jgi:glycerophosphoryl diester phosphodiesterase